MIKVFRPKLNKVCLWGISIAKKLVLIPIKARNDAYLRHMASIRITRRHHDGTLISYTCESERSIELHITKLVAVEPMQYQVT